MKQTSPDIMVSRKFLTRLKGRICYAFPQQIADELMWLIMLYVTGEDYAAARESVSEITRSFFSFIIFDLASAVERSRKARAAAARRRAAREAEREADRKALVTAATSEEEEADQMAAPPPRQACLSQGEGGIRGRPFLSLGVAAPRAP